MSGVSGVREHAILELVRSRAVQAEKPDDGSEFAADGTVDPVSEPSSSASSNSSSSATSSSSQTTGNGDALVLAPGEAEALELPRTLRELVCKYTTLTREAIMGLRHEFPNLRIEN